MPRSGGDERDGNGQEEAKRRFELSKAGAGQEADQILEESSAPFVHWSCPAHLDFFCCALPVRRSGGAFAAARVNRPGMYGLEAAPAGVPSHKTQCVSSDEHLRLPAS